MPAHRLLALAIAPLLASHAAQAATITVNDSGAAAVPGNAACTLPEALANANSDSDSSAGDCAAGAGADLITLPAGQTITLVSALPTISAQLSIAGNGATISRDTSVPCVLDGNSQPGEFQLLRSQATLAISDLTLSNGCADGANGGGLLVIDRRLTLDRVAFENNEALFNGGGLALSAEGSFGATISDSTFTGNSAGSGGGGLFTSDSATLARTTFSDNSAANGGAIRQSFRSLALTDVTLSNNRASVDGGGLHVGNDPAGTFTSTLSGCTIEGNDAVRGGGIFSSSNALSITDSALSGNAASASGGGLYSTHSLTLAGSLISGNDAAAGVGGLQLSGTGSSVIRDSTVAGNSGSSVGGLSLSGSGHTLARSTIADNSGGDAGGLQLVAGASSLQAVAVARNTGSVADLLLDPAVALTMTDSLVGNASGSSLVEAPLGSPDANNNLIGGASSGVIDPRLGSLTDNGGNTPTLLPQAGSALLDHFSGCSGNDQRGRPRGADGDAAASTTECDVGAVEFQYVAGFAVDDPLSTDQDQALAFAALGNEVDPLDDHAAAFAVIAVAGAAAKVGQTVVVSGGRFVIASNGSATFTPTDRSADDGESYHATIEYTVGDGLGSDSASATVTVAGRNDAPYAESSSARTLEGAPLTAALPAGDDDGDPLTAILVSAPEAGTVSFDAASAAFTFDPAAAFEALDDGESRAVGFMFKVNDGDVDSNASTFVVTVDGANDAPAAGNDHYQALAGRPLAVPAAEGLLANDTDVDVEPLSVSAGTFTPAGIGGTLVLAADGSFSYAPPANVTGTASHAYTVSDGTAIATATLTIDVQSASTLDLEITKSDGVSVVAANDVLSYTIQVLNHGPADAVGARVIDLLPADLGSASWTCEAVPPSATTACASASGSGDLDQTVDIAAGDAVVFELMATMRAPSASTISNTATVTAPAGLTELAPANNSATDVDATTRVFVDGFEAPLAGKRFEDRAMTLDSTALAARLPLDRGRAPLLLGRAASNAGFVLVHGRRSDDGVELRLSRFEHGEWSQGAWHAVTDARVELRW